MSPRITSIIEDIMDQYLEEDGNRPWIIGYSGGKDSTVVVTLVWEALLEIRKRDPQFNFKRKVYVVCNDTMVENPIIAEYVTEALNKMKLAAIEQKLPIQVRRTVPAIEETFWCCVIGKGYPVPNNSFRFCTDKLKIKPTSQFIMEQVHEMGEVIILIGTRLGESAQRARSIEKHEIKGHRLSKHPLNPNTYVYAPIKELMLEEVWYVIHSLASPWGFDNQIIYKIYLNANADDYECPTMVTSDTHHACGQSRFGCWMCTVVKKDKSMEALVQNVGKWMKPLLDFRNELEENRNLSVNRTGYMRNGREAVTEDGHNQGCYEPVYREQMLKKLLAIQQEIQKERPHVELISTQELIAISKIWKRDGLKEVSMEKVYRDIYGKDLQENYMKRHEKIMLEKICGDNKEDYGLIYDLLALQNSKSLMMRNYGLQNDLEVRLEKFVKGR